MENIGVIRNFRYFTPQAFNQLKTDLSISMEMGYLQQLSGLYRKFKRDPFVDELFLLDTLYKEMSATTMPLTFEHIYMANRELTATYNDFLAKKGLLGRGKAPLNTSFLLETANNYLTSHNGAKASCSIALLPFGSITTGEENLFAFSYKAVKKKDDDHLLFVSLSENDDKQGEVFEFLTSHNLEFVKVTTLEDGLFPALLSCYSGLICNLPCVSDGKTTLFRDFYPFVKKNTLLLRVNKESVASLMDEAKQKELPIFDAFALQSVPSYKISYGEISYDLPFEMLVGLVKICKVNAKEQLEKGDVVFSCGNREMGRYLLTKDSTFSAVCKGDLALCSFVSCGTFEDTYKALLTARETLILMGGNVKDVCLTAKIFVNKDSSESSCGFLFDTAMALYRFEAEFGLFASVSSSLGEENKVIVILGTKKGEDTSAKVGKVQLTNSSIYYIPLPESLEKSKWVDYDNILAKIPMNSISYTSGKNILADLEALESDNASVVCLEKELCERELPKGFLVETEGTCEYKKVAETSVKTIVETPLLDISNSCIYAEIPTILVVGEDEDKDAELLYKTLKNEKVEVTFAKASEYGKIARALLTAQILVLCGDVSIKRNNWTHYAMTVFHSANGQIARVKGAKGGKGVTKYPDGLPIPFWKR